MVTISCRYVVFYGYVRVYNQARDKVDLYPNQRLFFDREGNPNSFPIELREKIDDKYYESLEE